MYTAVAFVAEIGNQTGAKTKENELVFDLSSAEWHQF
jgi:hypothetical protein